MGRQRIATTARGYREAGAVEDHVGTGESLMQHVHAGTILQTRDVEGLCADAARGERIQQRVDGGCLCAFEDGAVEDDGGEGMSGPIRVTIQTRLGQFARRSGRLGSLGEVAAVGEEGRGILSAPCDKVLAQALAVLGCERRARRKFRVRLRVTRQNTEHDAALAGHAFDLVESIVPIRGATEDAQHDQLRAGERPFDVEIN